jgi:hypothetical protein
MFFLKWKSTRRGASPPFNPPFSIPKMQPNYEIKPKLEMQASQETVENGMLDMLATKRALTTEESAHRGKWAKQSMNYNEQ